MYYPKASVVAVETPSNGVLYNEYYIAIKDVTALNTLPEFNTPEWALLFGDNGIDSDIQVLLRDSDFIQAIINIDSELRVIRFSMDSDRHDWQAADSDLRLDMDSERHGWKAADSDLGIRIDSDRHDFIARDSELKYYVDSELRIVRADADSDRLEGFDRDSDLRAEFDSEFRIVRADADSDRLEGFDRDSDLRAEFDSEFRIVRADADSDRLEGFDRDSDIVAKFDSELVILRKDMDSDRHEFIARDSDLRADLDSDIRAAIGENDSDRHDFIARDSDLKTAIDSDRHDFLARDSELRNNLDSELRVLRVDIDSDLHYSKSVDSELYLRLDSEAHDRKADDSEIYVRIDSEVHALENADSDIRHKLRDIDSDLAILFQRTDSDEKTLQAIRTQLVESIDSEIRIRLEADSDLDVLIKETIHNYLANDSEIDSDFLNLKRRIDSEFDAAIRLKTFGPEDYDWGPTPYITSTEYYIDTAEITNHTIGYLWLVDFDRDNIYIIINGKTAVTYDTTGGDANALNTFIDANNVEWRRGTQVEESPGDDADVSIYQNSASVLPLVTNANLYGVQQKFESKAAHVEQVDLDTAFRRTVTTVVDMDSDINYLLAQDTKEERNYDSEIAVLTYAVNILNERVDSDLKIFKTLADSADSERHDWQSADSEIRSMISALSDSDIAKLKSDVETLFRQNDSEYRARRDADSELSFNYHGVSYRYVKYVEHVFDTRPGLWYIDFDGATGDVIDLSGHINGWVWNPVNDRLVISDSDGNVIYNKVHEAEPILVELDSDTRVRRGPDSGTNIDIRVNFSSNGTEDAYSYRLEHISMFERYKDYVLETFIDSDKTIQDADSENKDAFKWIGYWMRERDSEIKMEIHDRKAGDSDIVAEFRKPEETIVLDSDSEYVLTNPLLNEILSWTFVSEIESNGSIYRGVVGDDYIVRHDGTNWIVTVDGVNVVDYTTLTTAGSAQFSGQDIQIPWDGPTPLVISPSSSDSRLDVAIQINTKMLEQGVESILDSDVPSVRYPSKYRQTPDNQITPGATTVTLNGISFSFNIEFGEDLGYYYNIGDTITVRKK